MTDTHYKACQTTVSQYTAIQNKPKNNYAVHWLTSVSERTNQNVSSNLLNKSEGKLAINDGAVIHLIM